MEQITQMRLIRRVIRMNGTLPVMAISLSKLTSLEKNEVVAMLDYFAPCSEGLRLAVQAENVMMNGTVNNPLIDRTEWVIRDRTFIEVKTRILQQSWVNDRAAEFDCVNLPRHVGPQKGRGHISGIAADVQKAVASVDVCQYPSYLARITLFMAFGISRVEPGLCIEASAHASRQFPIAIRFPRDGSNAQLAPGTVNRRTDTPLSNACRAWSQLVAALTFAFIVL